MEKKIIVSELSIKYFQYKMRYLILEGENIGSIYNTVDKVVTRFLNTLLTKTEETKLIKRIAIDSGLDELYISDNLYDVLFRYMEYREYPPSLHDLNSVRVFPMSLILNDSTIIDNLRTILERELIIGGIIGVDS